MTYLSDFSLITPHNIFGIIVILHYMMSAIGFQVLSGEVSVIVETSGEVNEIVRNLRGGF